MNKSSKIFAAVAVAWACASAMANSIDWHSWQLVNKSNITDRTARELSIKDAASGRKVVIPADGVDLNKILKKTPQVGYQAILTKKVTVPQAVTVKLGMGVDWWFEVYCNNKIVYSTYRSGGNVDNSYTFKDHTFALNLHKGENLVTIYLVSGRKSFKTAIKELGADTPVGCVSRMTENEVSNPSRFQLRHGPWLLEPAPGAVTVAFLTDGNIPGGVEYRKAGTENWTQVWHTIGGVLHNTTDLHRVRLENLEPGKVYEYRVLTSADGKNHKAFDTYKFTAPPADESGFEFFATSDTQFGPARRGRLLQGWKKLLDKAAFQISVGDMTSIYDDFDAMLFGGYFNWQSPELYHGKPFIGVRGNHELRGREATRWFGLVGPSSGEGYYSFRYGKTFFVVLDSWGDDKDHRERILAAPARKAYLAKQRKWAENLVKSPEYLNARYRIILAHSAPYAVDPASRICVAANFVAEPLFKASLSGKARIHLYLAGHVHFYRRTLPGTSSVNANTPVAENHVRNWQNYNFPVVILDGPGKNLGFEVSATTVKVSADKLEVKSFDEKSRCFDHFTVDKAGVIKEIDNPYKKSILKLYKFQTRRETEK